MSTMSSIELPGYRRFEPPQALDFEHWSRREAQSYFEWFMDQVPQRVSELRRLARRLDGGCHLDGSPESLYCLGKILVERAKTRSSTAREIAEDRNDLPSRLRPFVEIEDWQLTEDTLSLCVDVGIYFAEIIREENSSLEWRLWTRKTVGYNRPVLSGFVGDVPLDPVRITINIVLGSVKDEFGENRLEELFHVWSAKVKG
jgi:hypothetical protein